MVDKTFIILFIEGRRGIIKSFCYGMDFRASYLSQLVMIKYLLTDTFRKHAVCFDDRGFEDEIITNKPH